MPSRQRPRRIAWAWLLAALVGGCGGPESGERATIAVATNFLDVAERLAAQYEARSGHRLRLVSGSTGQLYSQAVNGAPYDVFLAADEARPRRLVADGLAVGGSGFVYAVGRLVLWSSDPTRIGGDGAAVLARGDFRRLAIANPDLAPYGAAAKQALENMGAWEALRARIVLGENIGQAYALAATGNAELGLLALSQVKRPDADAVGSRWAVPLDHYDPIRQRAVLLTRAADNPAARGFLEFLGSPAARDVITATGYGVE